MIKPGKQEMAKNITPYKRVELIIDHISKFSMRMEMY